MKRLVLIFVSVMLAVSACQVAPVRAAARAVCQVCRVMEGSREAEKVEARRSHDGVEYPFCSEKCAKEFDADPEAFLPPVLPRLAPALTAVTLDGDTLSWESLKGKVVLLDFWATWCVPCRKSMAELQQLHRDYAGKGLAVVGVTIEGPELEARVRKFVASRKFEYALAMDAAEDPTWARFHVRAIPSAFLVDARGQIVAQWTGVAPSRKELERQFETLLPASK